MERFNPGYYTEADLKEAGIKSVGKNVLVARNCTIVGLGNIEIGNNVRIDGFTTLIAAGEGFIRLGSYIHIGGTSTLLASSGVVMDDFSCLSHGVKIYTRSDDYSGEFMTNPTVPASLTHVTSGTIIIGRHAIVGSQSSLLPNVHLAEGTAVGANSLVTKDTEAWSIYAGSPARRIKDRKRNPLQLERLIK
ncbi:acyltransferase [Dryocola sp. BD626]|jgi:acetyltransferase-like isoleucine patch superfamily enzyme|uniref:acyltransferase n=1 Tax=Dryocola sp. BD626 TaxID=3133273 RepID=UPI003F505632